MKILKTKKVNLAICWNGLRNVPPKDFPTVDEMDRTVEILNGLEHTIPEFVKIFRDGEQLNIETQSGKIDPKKVGERRATYQKESGEIESKEGKVEVEIEFEDSVFNTFFQQTERWAKNWFMKLEPYLEFRKDINKTNAQPKGK